ncbi:nucleotidyltransferase [Horticoccus luteus]|uniref:Nucleotidyltransferase n=1 Tax=Horticoccus luteus TaxID=2862869 RepID=A0A8F9XJP4_9BACT|nr:nucleotidyltransferase [Horticoccus luteus]QYM78878.1 nucleotidyltransferase [Horticoccus luteus]
MSDSPTSNSAPALLILAAGMGSRYGGLKQIDPVGPGGEAVLDYSVYDALAAGFGKLVFVIRRDFESAFREKVGRRFEARADVRYVFQERDALPGDHAVAAEREKPWGTGHAVWCARAELTEPFAVINADDFYGADSFRQLGRFLAATNPAGQPAHCCMIGFRLAKTLSEFGAVSRGICTVDADHHLTAVNEATGIERAHVAGHGGAGTPLFTGDEIVSMNCWGFTPGVLASVERQLSAFLAAHGRELKSEFYLPSAVTGLIDTGEAVVTVLPTAAAWFGVTYREDRPRVVAALQTLIETGAYPAALWA